MMHQALFSTVYIYEFISLRCRLRRYLSTEVEETEVFRDEAVCLLLQKWKVTEPGLDSVSQHTPAPKPHAIPPTLSFPVVRDL